MRKESLSSPQPDREAGGGDSARYRLNVAAILQNREGKILICERVDVPGAWQFPQGGVDNGETLEQALARELVEEIGLQPAHYRERERKGPYRYLFSSEATRKKKRADGQEQHYFLLDFAGPDTAIDICTAHPEFRATKWIAPADFDLRWLPAMKREVYRTVLADFFTVS